MMIWYWHSRRRHLSSNSNAQLAHANVWKSVFYKCVLQICGNLCAKWFQQCQQCSHVMSGQISLGNVGQSVGHTAWASRWKPGRAQGSLFDSVPSRRVPHSSCDLEMSSEAHHAPKHAALHLGQSSWTNAFRPERQMRVSLSDHIRSPTRRIDFSTDTHSTADHVQWCVMMCNDVQCHITCGLQKIHSDPFRSIQAIWHQQRN